MTQPKPKIILQRARALLAEHWNKGAWYDEEGQTYCALGAVQAAGSYSKDPIIAAHSQTAGSEKAIQYLMKAIPMKYGGSIIGFNDNPSTTHEDVLSAYDRAIELASKG